MRIIAGEFRSRRIESPAGMATRPTSDRLRETLFNVLSPRLAGCRFLDLYAGSGANGLEALSRGAREAVFVERAAPALAALRANLKALEIAGRGMVAPLAVRRWLEQAARPDAGSFDVIFLDPPYADGEEYEGTLSRLGSVAESLLSADGVVVAEHRRTPRPGKKQRAHPAERDLGPILPPVVPGEQYGVLGRQRVLEQGDAALSFYGKRP